VELEIRGRYGLQDISFCPNVVEVNIHSCDSLESLTGLRSVEIHSLTECENIKSISGFIQLQTAEIKACPELTSIDGMSGDRDILDDILEEARIISLENLSLFKDFSFRNIYSLRLSLLPGLTSLKDLQNIHHLSITDCASLTTTEGLGAISGSLSLQRCDSLEKLYDLRGVPKLVINGCPLLTDYSGIGNHKILRISPTPVFKKLLEKFRKEPKKNAEIFIDIQQLIFIQPNTAKETEIWNHNA
jgi:hypothetical protein